MKKEKTECYGIIGLGRFGMALAKSLAQAGKEIVVVDRQEEKVRQMQEYTENAFVTDYLSKETLMEMGIQNCDTVIICIGEQIDTNILTTLHVVSLGVPRVIAKAISEDQGEVLKKIGAEVVYPERDMALRVGRRLVSHNLMDYISLDKEVEIQQIPILASMIGKTVEAVNVRKNFGLNIIALERNGHADINIRPEDVFKEGDVLVVVGKVDDIKKFMKKN